MPKKPDPRYKLLERPGNRRYDARGPIVFMAAHNGYAMVRRPGCTPFVLFWRDWYDLAPELAKPSPILEKK